MLLRNRRAFAHALVGLAVILTISQWLYGTAMGYGYLPAIVKAALGNDGYGNPLGLIWHENVSLRAVALKAFGYLEKPDYTIVNPVYSRGFYVRLVSDWQSTARMVALIVEAIGGLWVLLMLLRRARVNEPVRAYWDWALVGLMMLVLAPQISQDYMVLTLGAFSFVLAGCMLYGTRAMDRVHDCRTPGWQHRAAQRVQQSNRSGRRNYRLRTSDPERALPILRLAAVGLAGARARMASTRQSG